MKVKKSVVTVISLILVACMLLPFAACGVVQVTGVELDRSSLLLDIGESTTLNTLVFPANASIKTASWRSSNDNIASVDKSGKVTGVAQGEATIKVSVGGKEATCAVTVYDSSKLEVEVTGVSLDPETLSLNADNRVATLTATITPSNATDQTLTWTTSNDKIAKVQNGVVTAVGAGYAVITATSVNNFSATCAVRVEGDFSQIDPPVDDTIHVDNVTLEPSELSLTVGRTGQLSATVLPEDATNKAVQWASSNEAIAEVDDNGIVTAKAQGQVTITVTTVDGNKTAECAVTVREASADDVSVTGVTLNKNTLALTATRTETLTATVAPANATDQNVTWSSNKPSVATVDNAGKVTAVAEGTATITVTTSDGGFTAECVVTVTYAAATLVSISQSTLEINNIGATAKLTATVRPNTANPAVNWSSDNTSVATVVDGVVTAIGFGTATITATSADGAKSATCAVTVKLTSDEIYVADVSSLSTRTVDFIMGMDASAVPSIEAARKSINAPLYKNFAGEEEDVFKILKDNGITDIRIRVWNDPTDGKGNSYGGGNCDIDNAVVISKRCQAVGLGVIIDFHYSDFWADPEKQTIPKAWASYTTSQVENAIYTFTKESLEKVKATGVKITMVQVGNETTSGMAGSSDWTVISKYMNAGSKAIREVTGEVANGGAKVAVHFTNPESKTYLSKAANIRTVDYDVFGTSYYPYWHGTLSNLAEQLKAVHDSYNKEVMVLETSYAFTNDEFDGIGNTNLSTTPYPVSVQGQSNAVRAVIETCASLGDWGLGVCYWEGTWIPASTQKNATYNTQLCTQYGCGWASYYAHDYDSSAPANASSWTGCVIDNQAFFRTDGTPLESLKVFALVKGGNNISVVADQYDKQEGYYTVNTGPIELPTMVWATLNEGSYIEIPVNWFITSEELDEYLRTVGVYEIEGTTAYGGTCIFTLWILNPNLLTGGSFETDEGITGYDDPTNFVQSSGLGDWKLERSGGTSALQLYVSTDSGNARMGDQSFHFWDSGTVNFKLYQSVDLTKLTYGNGTYSCRFDIMGGDGASMNIFAYIKITYTDGTSTTTNGNSVELTEWLDWQTTTASVDISDLSKVKSIEVGISVYAEADGNGPWGNIDNAQFYFG